MKFGLFGGARTKSGDNGDSQSYRRFIDYVLHAEELGYHGVFVVEHHFTGVGQVSASLNLLSFLAGRTSRIRLGTAVIVLPWHNPVLLAEQVATLDVVSDGRVDFGVGKGYRDSEFDGFCMSKEEAAERFEEDLAVLRKAWGGERFSHHGKYWKFNNIIVEPQPAQRPHPPLWMGAGSFEGIRRAGHENFNLLLDQIASIELVLERVAVYRSALAERGLPFDGMRIGLTRALQIVRNEEERQQAYEARRNTLRLIGGLARGPGAERYQNPQSFAEIDIASENAALIGTSEEIVARLRQLQAGGVDYVLLIDVAGSKDTLRIFMNEIAPELAAGMRVPEAARG
jgi:alkanesulfonate monooxygenase SsuD/methylene tetrahydromethanopterin reductase-like flavin-dependent oxidoreductase (luciferase family)